MPTLTSNYLIIIKSQGPVDLSMHLLSYFVWLSSPETSTLTRDGCCRPALPSQCEAKETEICGDMEENVKGDGDRERNKEMASERDRERERAGQRRGETGKNGGRGMEKDRGNQRESERTARKREREREREMERDRERERARGREME